LLFDNVRVDIFKLLAQGLSYLGFPLNRFRDTFNLDLQIMVFCFKPGAAVRDFINFFS